MCRIQDNYVHEYQAIRNHLSWTQELRRYKREASNMFELPHRQHGRGYSSISKSNEFTETSRLLFVIRIFALSAPLKLGRVSDQQGAAQHFFPNQTVGRMRDWTPRARVNGWTQFVVMAHTSASGLLWSGKNAPRVQQWMK